MKKYALSVALVALLVVGYKTTVAKPAVTGTPAVYSRDMITNPEDALKLLKDGNYRFVKGENLAQDLSLKKREILKTDGQFPFVTILSCSDSRVVSPHAFNQGLGDIFEVKLAGNVVDQDALGSIEYGITALKTPLLVILAHESCGAVYASVDVNNKKMSLPSTSSLHGIVNKIIPSHNKVKSAHTHNLSDIEMKELVTEENARAMKVEILKNPAIKAKVDSGETKIIIAKYMLDGTIVWE